ncbi:MULTISPECIES: hypothetical protein [unclassified Schlesneria]|uniref:hypothetical protein n=1 Tax=Schlesneria TaxID=656899 RepID=UPI00359F15D6
MPCDDTKPDSNLAADTAITVNDGASPNWWLSPDIDLNGFTDTAAGSVQNTIDVTVHRSQSPLPDGTAAIVVEVYVCNPGLNLGPGPNAKLIAQTIMRTETNPEIQAGQTRRLSDVGKIIKWTPNGSATDPDGPGHRCLIARCYPDSLSPEPDCFHVVGDRHAAQRNVTIAAAAFNEPFSILRFWTGNNNQEDSQKATVRVVADLNPSRKVIEALMPALRAVEGFRRIGRTPPAKFSVRFDDFEVPTTRDNSKLVDHGPFEQVWQLMFGQRSPTYEADIELAPGQQTYFELQSDLTGGRPGDATIFHLTHINPNGRVTGGLTCAIVLR